MDWRLLALRIGCLLGASGLALLAAQATASEPSITAQALPPGSMPAFFGAEAFYDHGFTGDGVVLAILDRGWINANLPGLDAPGRVAQFVRWIGLPHPALGVSNVHATAVAGAAAADLRTWRMGVAPGAELWSVAVFTHPRSPWITSPNPPLYGLLVAGRFGVGGRTAHVLNNSWSWNVDRSWTFAGDTHVTYAADAIALDGAVVVVAANNFRRPPEPPGDGWNAITVGATGDQSSWDVVAGFSNRGPSPSFFCPCEDLPVLKRSTVDILAPGAYTPYGSGTSVSAPLVSGGAALVVDKGLSRGYSIDPRVVKAVLLNSARPLPGWRNGAAQVGRVWLTDQPMDYAQGAGQLSLTDAYRQYDAPAQSGEVGLTGWDLGSVAAGAPREYRLHLPLQGGRPFVATLVWFMHRDVAGYDPGAADPLAGSAFVDLGFDNLDLTLEREGEGGGEPVAASTSIVDSVEHIRFDVPETGRYALRVDWTEEVFDREGDADDELYALAWKAPVAEFCAPDVEAPLLECPADLAVECGGDTSPEATGEAEAADDCALASTTLAERVSPACGGTAEVQRAWVSTDESGNASECSQTISVIDSTPPELGCAVSRARLWPPDSGLVDVGFSFRTRDGCDGAPLATAIAVTSDEGPDRERGGGGGRCPDAVVEPDGKVRLRAERSGAGDGRVYRIAVTATDACGNASVCAVPVSVPHSAGAKGAALDSGQRFDPTACEGSGAAGR